MPRILVDDFSKFVTALASSSPHGWHVVATNDGPPTDIITWHNEYGVCPSHPHYVVFFCEKPPPSGEETPGTSSLAVYDRLKKECPELLEQSAKKVYTYKFHHTAVQTRGLVGGNGVFSPTAFGPVDESLPVEQQRKFTGGLDITHRVTGIRMHPTRNVPSYFNAMANRWAYANKYNTWEPPYTASKEDGTEQTFWPPMFSGMEEDKVIPKEWMDKAGEIQNEFVSTVAWEAGNVMVIDNFAVQHARLPWEGHRTVLASFWDEPGLRGVPMNW
ncbi:hypothetical protein N7493_010107 [Penicillium malachiteum]|uniref:TauD/TfdA-like domain-containing protein n=1 Tax=Penicillium malachiteum TaxID=1324776 RepID=A0AAD6MRD4_9EURO|nr:hypothetical protein N7493_010107 [Penicillium malachiteum]